jgi:hypothetical protein
MFRKRFEQLMDEVPATEEGKSSSSSLSYPSAVAAPSGGAGAALSTFFSTFMVGDIVKVKQGFMMHEAVVVDVQHETLDVDFGDDIETVPLRDCCLVMNGLDFEVGDYVSACPAGDLYFNGRIVSINSNGTFDVLFDGDDAEDTERNIRPDKLRKIRTGRQLVLNRWQKAKNLISMSLAWGSVSHGLGEGEEKGREEDEREEKKGESKEEEEKG